MMKTASRTALALDSGAPGITDAVLLRPCAVRPTTGTELESTRPGIPAVFSQGENCDTCAS